MKRPKEKISRAFKRDFPWAVPMVEALDLDVYRRPGPLVNDMPTYWLADTYQLTGYRTTEDGSKFTKEFAAEHIREKLEWIATGRAEVAAENLDQRFTRIIEGMKTIKLQYRFFCIYRHPSGDRGTILYRGDPICAAWVRFWDGKDDVAHAQDVPLAQLYEALTTSFRNGGAKFSGRKAREVRP